MDTSKTLQHLIDTTKLIQQTTVKSKNKSLKDIRALICYHFRLQQKTSDKNRLSVIRTWNQLFNRFCNIPKKITLCSHISLRRSVFWFPIIFWDLPSNIGRLSWDVFGVLTESRKPKLIKISTPLDRSQKLCRIKKRFTSNEYSSINLLMF